MNDKIFDRINDEWTDMTVEDLKDWLETHKETYDVVPNPTLGAPNALLTIN